jgi:hypothetical protein
LLPFHSDAQVHHALVQGAKRDPFGKGRNAREAVPVIHLQDKRGESDYVVVNGAGGANAECFGSR